MGLFFYFPGISHSVTPGIPRKSPKGDKEARKTQLFIHIFFVVPPRVSFPGVKSTISDLLKDEVLDKKEENDIFFPPPHSPERFLSG